MKNKISIFLLILVSSSCYDYKEYFDSLDQNLLPKVLLLPSVEERVSANGNDSLEIRVIFPLGSSRDLVKVNFSTTEGVFLENLKAEFSSTELRRKDDEFFVRAILKSTTNKGPHYLTVEVPEILKTIRPINYAQSYPASISIGKNKFAVQRTFADEIQLTAKLLAAKGLPTSGTAVEFIVADSLSSNSSNHFRLLSKTDKSGIASVFFSPGDFNGFIGELSYKAITLDENGNALEADGFFQVIEPE